MNKVHNVLIFPAGEMNSAELHEALSGQVNIEVFGASSVERHGRHLFERYRSDMPFISSPDFFPSLNALVKEWGIDLIIPSHDSVVDFFSDNRHLINTKVLVPSTETAKICRSKSLTYDFFGDCGFVPKRYLVPPKGSVQAFVKPDKGQGSVGARLVDFSSGQDLPTIDWANEVVTEYLPGDELTVDCFTDRHGVLLGIFPRSRDRVLGGISVSGASIEATSEIEAVGQEINERLKFLGLWYFQVKRSSQGAYKLMEISARCAGGQAITRARGFNLPVLSVYAAMGRDVRLPRGRPSVRVDRIFKNIADFDFEYDEVFVDYDDCIINGANTNPDLMRFLYQSKNLGKKTTLITKHDGDILSSLAAHRISETLFDRIVHLGEGDKKSDYVSCSRSIFIDNAFSEREEVSIRCGIPVFDVEGVEMIQVWRK